MSSFSVDTNEAVVEFRRSQSPSPRGLSLSKTLHQVQQVSKAIKGDAPPSETSTASVWEGCGSRCTKSMVTYFAQLLIALCVIGLCIGKLSTTTLEPEKTMYLSTMMSVVAYFMPHPQFK